MTGTRPPFEPSATAPTVRVRRLLSNLRNAVLMTLVEWCVRGLSTEAQAGLRLAVKSDVGVEVAPATAPRQPPHTAPTPADDGAA